MGRNELNVRSQFRGFLFELAIGKLLEMNNFSRINKNYEPEDRVRENRLGFTEFRGRGCWHQIDCPYDYKYTIPFSYPLRLLGEVKFLRRPVQKDDIREFIGVFKDIQENHFANINIPIEQQYPRKQEIGFFVSANGFDDEAELLAYAHCIKTLSYNNNPILSEVKKAIYTLSKEYLVPNQLNAESRSRLRRIFVQQDMRYNEEALSALNFFRKGYEPVLGNLFSRLYQIRTSFMGVTETGIFLHFTSLYLFPFYLFHDTDYADCQVFFDMINATPVNFRLIFSADESGNEFFFCPPTSLVKIAKDNPGDAIFYKEEHFKAINVSIYDDIHDIRRNITLQLDPKWIIEVHQKNRT